MAHIGILTVRAMGHLYPSSTLGLELKKRGHRVTFFGIPDAMDFCQGLGLGFVTIGARDYPIGKMASLYAELGKLKGRAGLQFTMDMLITGVSMAFEDLPGAVKANPVDALVIDQLFFAGSTVANSLSIPYVHLANALLFNTDDSVPPINFGWPYKAGFLARLRNRLGYAVIRKIMAPVKKMVNEQRLVWGLAPLSDFPDDLYAGHPQISQLPPSLEYPRQHLPADLHFVGPLHDLSSRSHLDFPWDRLDGRPILYASVGTLQNGLEWIFRIILEATQTLDVQLVLTLGGNLDPAIFASAKGNPVIVRYAPQLEVLKRASVAITHGGLNTINESLAHGIPMVAIPITNDQPAAGARIEWSGVGLSVTAKQLTVERLRTALRRVLTEPSYRLNAQRLQREIASLDAVKRASEVVESVLVQGETVG